MFDERDILKGVLDLHIHAGPSIANREVDAADMPKAVPLSRIILDSDMGQRGNGSPVEGMYRFIRLLMNKFGLSEADINLIAKKNPAALLGV